MMMKMMTMLLLAVQQQPPQRQQQPPQLPNRNFIVSHRKKNVKIVVPAVGLNSIDELSTLINDVLQTEEKLLVSCFALLT